MTGPGLVPRHAAGVELRQTETGAQLRRGDRSALVLDTTALALWEVCDGDTTVEEMTAALCALFDAEASTISHDIDLVLRALTDAGALDWVPAPRAGTDVPHGVPSHDRTGEGAP